MNLLALAIPLVLLLAASICDLRRREVPDAIPLAMLLWACGATVFGVNVVDWPGLLGGLALGLVLAAAAFQFGRLGGGDAKLMAAVGAVLGPAALLFVLFWMAIAGGMLAVVAAARGRRDFAYVPAIAAGFVAHLVHQSFSWHHFLNS